MLKVDQGVVKYNLAAHNSNVRVIARFISHHFSERVGDVFISLAAEFCGFPYLSIAELLSSCARSGAVCTARHADVEELLSLQFPALIFINRRPDLPYSLEVVQIQPSQSGQFVIHDEFNELSLINIDDMRMIYSGIVVFADGIGKESWRTRPVSKSFVLHKSVIMPNDCDDIVKLCEQFGFSDIPNSDQSLLSPIALDGGGELGMRLNLHATGKTMISRLEVAIAKIGLKSGLVCEGAECFKISSHCKAYRRFDSGVNLRRRMSVHIAVGYRQSGINLRFTEYHNDQTLRAGDAVSIESCDGDGRTNWRSEWSLRPPQHGNIYLISCWFI